MLVVVKLVPPLSEYVYGAVPPEAVTVMLPLDPPLQLAWVDVELTEMADGWLTVWLAVIVQPLASCTVRV